jgi:LmbE family N-acetylglucosaminyl deacetylase
MCHIANGCLGHMEILPEELIKIRDKEARRAAETLGAESISLDVNDCSVEAGNKEIVAKLVEVVRYTKADIIITHNTDDYMRDHLETSMLAYDASFVCTLPHLETETEFHNGFPPVFYMDTLAGIGFIPTEYVDITEEMEQKLEAVSCHESQVKWMLEHDHIDFLDFIRTCNKYRGLQSNCTYAEGFRQYAGWPRFRTKRMLP